MRRSARLRLPEKGLSLVETLAALLVFSLITLGVAPLILTSIRGGTVARSFTIGKTLAQRGLEQVRGLPYYVAAGTPAQRIDVLDMYFPFGANLGGANYSGGAYTTVCTSSTVSPACSTVVPSGYEVRYKAEFVAPQGTTPETYVLKVPPAAYAWDSATTDRPESQLLRMTVTSFWTAGGRPRSFSLTSIVGDRRAAEDKIRGVGRVDYAVQVIGTYVAPITNRRSELRVVAGTSESRIEVRLLSQADQSVLGGVLRLTEEAVAPDPATVTDSVDGAITNLHAPPDAPTAAGAVDTIPNPAQSPSDNDITHPDATIGRIAFLERSATSGLTTTTLKTTAENGLPYTEGKFELNDLGTGLFDLWVHNQARTGADAPLLLSPNTDGTKPVFGVVPLGAAGQNTTEGTSSAATGAVTAPDRRVETTASVVVRQVNLFPVIFGPQPGNPLIRIKNLSASVRCNSTANLATSIADATYTATIQYLRDPNPTNGAPDATYTDETTLQSSNASDPLAAVGLDPGDTNPLVYEDPLNAAPQGSPLDVYLFGPVQHTLATHPDHVVPHTHRGYIQQWESKTASTIFESNAGAGRTTSARLDGAISIVTRPSDPDRPETSLAISLAKLVCEAVDRR